MARSKLYSAYITEELNNIMDFLIEREEVTTIVFVRRALRVYLAGERKVNPKITNNKRSDPEFIRRTHMWTGKVDVEQLEELEQVAEQRKCKTAHVFFQALVNYCSELIHDNNEGFTIKWE